MRLPSLLSAAALALLAATAALPGCTPAPAAPVLDAPPPPRAGVDPPAPGAPVVAGAPTFGSFADVPTTPDPPPIVELRQRIAGRENERAGVVFQNVTALPHFTASQLLTTMTAFNEALGVRCTFCHTAGQWAAETSDHKAIARGMIAMTHRINAAELVRAGADDGSRVTCYTCHRARPRPQLNPADTARRRPPPVPSPGRNR